MVVPQKQNTTTVYAAPGSTVVVKDVKGKVRDVDEYNRRYTSRDNNFSMENDTLYIEEKPLNERGNGLMVLRALKTIMNTRCVSSVSAIPVTPFR